MSVFPQPQSYLTTIITVGFFSFEVEYIKPCTLCLPLSVELPFVLPQLYLIHSNKL